MSNRTHRRFAVDKEIECHVDDEIVWATLYHLSVGGCMIDTNNAHVGIGRKIRLNLHDVISMDGFVVWKEYSSLGVRFEWQLSEDSCRHLGFSNSTLGFDETKPRDQFGQLLPHCRTGMDGSSHACDPADPSASTAWQTTARLQEDRREFQRSSEQRRSEERLEIDAKARICTSMRDGVEGYLTDLSTSGCSFLDHSGLLKPNDEIWLKMEALEPWKGVVRWVNSGKVGIEFGRPFYPAIVNHLVELHRPVMVALAA